MDYSSYHALNPLLCSALRRDPASTASSIATPRSSGEPASGTTTGAAPDAHAAITHACEAQEPISQGSAASTLAGSGSASSSSLIGNGTGRNGTLHGLAIAAAALENEELDGEERSEGSTQKRARRKD